MQMLCFIFIVLISASSANADLLDMAFKFVFNEYIKNKEAKEKTSEIKPTFEDWIKSLKAYVSETGTVGDCKTIGFDPLYNNRGETKNFYYECGVREGDSVAFLHAKSKNKIGDCQQESTFGAKFDIRKNYIETYSLPSNPACIFFKGPDLNQANKEELKGLAYVVYGGSIDPYSMRPLNLEDIDMRNGSPRSKTEIMDFVNSQSSYLKIIFTKFLDERPGFSGNVTLTFSIAPSGDITTINVTSSNTGVPKFDEAIKNEVAKWKWNTVRNSGTAVVTIPFDFAEGLTRPKSAKSKGGIKFPSAKDIDMGNDDASRSRAEIMAVVNQRVNGLKSIYNRYVKNKPGFTGKVTLKFTIAPSGDIISISTVSSTTNYPEFDNAIKDQVSSWKWKPIKNGNTAPTIPFNFRTEPEGEIKALNAEDIDIFSDIKWAGRGNISRSKMEILDFANQRIGGLETIYNKYLKNKPGFTGKVTLKFTIASIGDITTIDIVSSTTGYPEFDNAIKNQVAKWKWKVISNNAVVTIPFDFVEQKAAN